MAEIPVAGAVLIWAREFRSLSLGEAADKLGMVPDDLEAIEQQKRKPTLTEFERIAAAYRLPLATLFRRTPPKVPPEPSDFRTFDGAPATASFEYRVSLSNVRTLQAALRVLKAEDQYFQSAQLRRYDFRQNPFQRGEDERREIGVSIDRQLDWQAGDGFRHWRAIIEHLGISVYLQKFSLGDCRGYSLWDEDVNPAIVINKSDRSENAWVFSLLHEYAHLLIRRPGISDMNPANPTEAFCNRFAAAFLMPTPALRSVLPLWPDKAIEWPDETIRGCARRLNVSAQALAIRLEELGIAQPGLNRRFVAQSKAAEKPDGGNYVNTRLSEIGGHFTASVMGALDRDIIDSVHASEALGLSPPHLEAARAYVERQRQLASA
jgi:Zn-dependent peptidase ImmA (M78 family)